MNILTLITSCVFLSKSYKYELEFRGACLIKVKPHFKSLKFNKIKTKKLIFFIPYIKNLKKITNSNK